jgi:hypothetical protein
MIRFLFCFSKLASIMYCIYAIDSTVWIDCTYIQYTYRTPIFLSLLTEIRVKVKIRFGFIYYWRKFKRNLTICINIYAIILWRIALCRRTQHATISYISEIFLIFLTELFKPWKKILIFHIEYFKIRMSVCLCEIHCTILEATST